MINITVIILILASHLLIYLIQNKTRFSILHSHPLDYREKQANTSKKRPSFHQKRGYILLETKIRHRYLFVVIVSHQLLRGQVVSSNTGQLKKHNAIKHPVHAKIAVEQILE